MITNYLERDVETLIDIQLKNIWWIDNPKSNDRNIWKQQPKTITEKEKLSNLRPDYVLYETWTNRPLIVIEAKKPNRDLNLALNQWIQYAKLISAPIVIATDWIINKTFHVSSLKPLYVNWEEVDYFIDEKTALNLTENNEYFNINKKVIKSRKELIDIFSNANKLLRQEWLAAWHERFSEFSNILFLKLISEIQDINEQNWQKVQIEKEYRWDYFKNKHWNELLSYVNDTVLKNFDKLYNNWWESLFDRLHIKNPNILKDIINQIDQLQLTDINSDIKWDAFEYFIRQYTSWWKDLWQYFTPRHIVRFLVKLLNPRFWEIVYDPFCWTWWILIETYKHLYRTTSQSNQTLNFLKNESLYWREISSTARIAKMNMILIWDWHNNIERTDTLKKPVDNKYDVVITNMPFAQDTDYGNLYDIPTRDANSICIQHCIWAINKLSENWRLWLIVPEKILFDKNYEQLREYILKNCIVENIISLPSWAFEPYTNVQTSILHLTKVKKWLTNKNINFFFVKNDWFSLDKNRKPLHWENDLDKFLLWEKDWLWFSVDVDRIKDNNYILQWKKYIDYIDLAKITFNTDKLIKLDKVFSKIKLERVDIEEDQEYNVLWVRSYWLWIFNKSTMWRSLSKWMKYYKANEWCLFWCKVDTKNWAFWIITSDFNDSIFTSNMNMLAINSKVVNPYYLQLMFRNPKFQEYLDNYISWSTNRKYIKTDELLNFYIPDIDIKKQNKIANEFLKTQEEINNNQNVINWMVEDMTKTI